MHKKFQSKKGIVNLLGVKKVTDANPSVGEFFKYY